MQLKVLCPFIQIWIVGIKIYVQTISYNIRSSLIVYNGRLYAIVTYYRRDNIFIWEMAVFINVSDFAILVSDYSIGITYRFNRNNGVVI